MKLTFTLTKQSEKNSFCAIKQNKFTFPYLGPVPMRNYRHALLMSDDRMKIAKSQTICVFTLPPSAWTKPVHLH